MSKLQKVMVGAKEVLSHESSSDLVLVLGCIEVIVKSYIVYGFDLERHDESVILHQIITLARHCFSSGLSWLKYFKLRIADFFAAWNDQEIAGTYTGCNARYFLGGPFYNYTRKLCCSKATKLSFTTTILQTKKGMPRPTDEMVKVAVAENISTMTHDKEESKPYVCNWESCRDFQHQTYGEAAHFETFTVTTPIEYNRVAAEQQIRRTVRELFGTWSISLEQLTKPYLPSPSANVTDSVQDHGTYGTFELTEAWRDFRSDVKSEERLPTRLCNTECTDYVSDHYGAKGEQDELEYADLTKSVPALEVDTGNLERAYRKFYWRMTAEALNEPKDVKVIGLKEALKIRSISKGPPKTYFVLKPLQKSLWSHMKDMPQFKLIGTPITEDLINEQMGPFLKAFTVSTKAAWKFHSGDYRGATDNIYQWASNLVADCLMDQNDKVNGFANTSLRELFLSALTGHNYVQAPVGQQSQKVGQLMGSIVSFVVLCILNFVIMRWSYEIAHQVIVPAKKFPGMINGDDCLTPYNDERFPEIWENIAKLFGFEKSLGKTYASGEFFSMNSTTFAVHPDHYELVPYVNFGLMTGMKRSLDGVTDGMKVSELGVLHHQLIEEAPSTLGLELTAMFIQEHKELLNSVKQDIPWFLPSWMGGLGLKQLCEWSDIDRHHAYIARELNQAEPLRLRVGKVWKHYDVLNEFVDREGCYLVVEHNFRSYQGEEDHGPVFTAVIYDTWARKGLRGLLETGRPGQVDGHNVEALRRRTRKIRKESLRLVGQGCYPRVKDDSVFTYESKQSIVPLLKT